MDEQWEDWTAAERAEYARAGAAATGGLAAPALVRDSLLAMYAEAPGDPELARVLERTAAVEASAAG